MSDDGPSDLSAGELPDGQLQLTNLALEDKARTLLWKEKVFWGGVGAAVLFYGLALAVVFYWVFVNPPYRIDFEHGLIVAVLLVTGSVLSIQVFKLVDNNTAITAGDIDNHPYTKLVRDLAAITKAVK